MPHYMTLQEHFHMLIPNSLNFFSVRFASIDAASCIYQTAQTCKSSCNLYMSRCAVMECDHEHT